MYLRLTDAEKEAARLDRLQNPLPDTAGSLLLPDRFSDYASSSSDGEDGASSAAPSATASLGEKGGKDSNGMPPKLSKEKKE